MKAFVSAYSQDPKGRLTVRYSAEPVETWPSLNEAGAQCRVLNGGKVGSGSHLCEFHVDSLPGGRWGVYCEHHPDLEVARSPK